jgi:tetratricopeptide (TPR) repeat protein
VGKLDEAAECFERAGEINPMALAQLVRTGKMPRNPQALEKMSSIADNRLMAKAARSSMCFALADLYDREQEFDKAARFMTTANELVNSELNYSADQFSRKIDNIIRVFSEDYFENLPAIRGSDRVPVFVVGMPRSGTTLTEQILSSHPQVFGAGELELLPVLTRLMPRVLKAGSPFPGCMRAMTGELREEAARYYLYGLQQHDEASHYVVDKMPHNFVNLGLIASVLPGARIVHVSRDPRDTALSNYLQNFKAREGGLGYAFQLGNLARQLNDYARIMSHWRQVLPAPVFELSYEELVEDQEGVTRKLLQFIGVDWHDDVRDFHKTERAIRTASVSQVRQPIYKTSRQKWRNYEEMLQPLISLLEQELPGR